METLVGLKIKILSHLKSNNYLLETKFYLTIILYSVNLDICHGKLVAVIGQIGCGKSTLISTLLGLTKKDSGYIGIDVFLS